MPRGPPLAYAAWRVEEIELPIPVTLTVLIDMNLSPLWVPFLVEHEIEAVHWSTVGEASAPDSQSLGYAGSNGFTLFTHDLDFLVRHIVWNHWL